MTILSLIYYTTQYFKLKKSEMISILKQPAIKRNSFGVEMWIPILKRCERDSARDEIEFPAEILRIDQEYLL